MDFSDMLTTLRQGGKARRSIWREFGNLRGAFVEIIPSHSLPDGRIVMETLMIGSLEDNILRPFSGANWDLLADDWEIVE